MLTYPLQFYPAINTLERIAGVGPGARLAKARSSRRPKRKVRRPSGGAFSGGGGGGDGDAALSSDESDEDDADAEAAALLESPEAARPYGAQGDSAAAAASRLSDAQASVWIQKADGGLPAVAFRLFFVAATALVAILVSDLTRLINLVGIIFAPALAFVFPALCDLVAAHRSPRDYHRETWELAVSAVVLCCAVVASFVGSAQQVIAFLAAAQAS